MIRKELDGCGPERLQSRLAAMLVQEACKYVSRILIEQGDKTVNVKSMMGMLSLGVPTQEPLSLVIEGSDESIAMDTLLPLVNQIFKEA